MESGVSAHLVVAASTKLPERLDMLGTSGKLLSSVEIKPISSLPPAPRVAGAPSYAAAAMGGGVVLAAGGPGIMRGIVPRQPAAPEAGTAHAPGHASGAGPAPRSSSGRRHGSPGDGGSGHGVRASSPPPARRTAGDSRRQLSPGGGGQRQCQRQLSPSSGRHGRPRTRSPLRRAGSTSPSRSPSPSGANKKQIVTTAAGCPAAVPSVNPFAQLAGADDMDASPADMAAHLAAPSTANGGCCAAGS